MGELILDPNGAYLLFRSANLLQISTVPCPPPLSDRPIPTRGTPPKHRIVSKYLLAYQKTVLNL